MSEEQPSYFGIIPAKIRYDNDLSNSQKLFFSELTALTQKEGYCWASNNYFAKLYDVDPSTVSRWVKGLENKGYIAVKYDREGKQIKGRKIIPLVNPQGIEINQGGIALMQRGYCKNGKGNNTSNNNTRESDTPQEYEIPTQQQVEDYFRESGKILEEDISLEAQKFINHYEDMDWRKNRGKGDRIDNWHRQAGTWMANYQQYNRDRLEDNSNSNAQMQFV